MTLYEAVLFEDAAALAALAAEARDINEPFEGGRTALHEAAMRGHVELVKVLLAAGADPGLKDLDHETPLLKAAVWGRLEVVALLSPLAGDDQRDLARALLGSHRVPFDPDAYHGRDEEVPEWRRSLAQAAARVCQWVGDDRATARLQRVERSEAHVRPKRK